MEKSPGSPLPELLKPAQAARLIKFDEATLANWRCKGIGPAFIKMGTGPKARVRYKVTDLIAWEKSLTRTEPAVKQNVEAAYGRL